MLFADFINWAIEQSGITNYKLAKRLNVSQTTIANWCNGVTEPREKKRAEALSLFGVDEFDLEQGFPDIHLKEDFEKQEKPSAQGGGLTEEENHLILLFRQVPKEQRAAMLQAIEMTLRSQGLL